MRQSLKIALTLSLIAVLASCGPRVSGTMGRACLGGGRDAASPALCSCVQRVADRALSAADQRRAARFFDNPQLAQNTRQSDRAGDEAFWDRYRAFADRAERTCG